jgi:serine protease Do
LTGGIVSGVRKMSSIYSATNDANILFIQTDAAINKGNSGGPLFHKNYVVGVNTQGLAKDETEGLNFAVHVDEIQKFLRN